MTRQWSSPDLPPEPDPAVLRELTRFESDPGLDHRRRRNPAIALVPVAAALFAVIALAAIGAAHMSVFAVRHWIGVLMLVALGWAASLLVRGCRRGH